MKIILVDAINTFVIPGVGVFRAMQELLDTYPNRKVILTSANDEQVQKFGLHQMPYEVFTLKHDPEKSDPKYYELLCTHLGILSHDMVYFEHNEEAVQSARSVGIETYHYDKNTCDLAALKKFLDNHLA